MCASVRVVMLEYVAWSVLVFFFVFASQLRGEIRARDDVEGNMAEDFFAFVLLYPLACMQMSEQVVYACAHKKNDDHVMEQLGPIPPPHNGHHPHLDV